MDSCPGIVSPFSFWDINQLSEHGFCQKSLTAFDTGFAEPARDAGFLEGGLADDAGLLEAFEDGFAALGGLEAALEAGFAAAAALEGGLEPVFVCRNNEINVNFQC